MKLRHLSILAIAIMWSCITGAAEYLYSDLKMKSYDDMLAAVKDRVQKAEKVANDDLDTAKAKLRDALKLVFSRPNQDNMVSQLIPPVRTSLKNMEAYDTSIAEVVDDALFSLQNKKSKAGLRATSLVVLENVMSELKPDIASNPIVKDIFVKIRDAKIEIPNDVKTEFRMRASMKPPASPSEIAAKVLSASK